MANLKLSKSDTNATVLLTEKGDNWKKFLDSAEKKLISNLELKGFRKGKVPTNIAKKNISQQKIWTEAANSLVESNYKDSIDLLMKEKIATQPIVNIDAVSNDEVKISITSSLMPKVTLGDISSINLEYKVEKVTKEEVDAEIKNLETMLQKQEIMGKDSLVENGDIANIDFLGTVDGKEFEGGKSEKFDLVIGSKQFIEGFEEQVIGMKAGEEKDVNVTFPKTYPEEKLKGKPALFKVKLNSIKKNVPLEGKELKEKLKSFGFDTKEEIIKKIKEVSKQRKVQVANEKFFNEYIDEISKLKGTKISVPKEILDQEIEQEYKRFQAQISQQGLTIEKYMKMLGMTIEEFKDKNLKQSAEKRVKNGLIYSQLVDNLKIKATDSEVEEEYKKITENSNGTIEEIKKQFPKGSIESNIIFDKLIKKLKK